MRAAHKEHNLFHIGASAEGKTSLKRSPYFRSGTRENFKRLFLRVVKYFRFGYATETCIAEPVYWMGGGWGVK